MDSAFFDYASGVPAPIEPSVFGYHSREGICAPDRPMLLSAR
eukprot:SAG25_NODE_1438_length_3023_cov_1.870041_8_plen_42_part_00